MTVRILHGDVREVLCALPSDSVHCVVTSPPYYGLRDYGTGTWEGGDPACGHKRGNARQDHTHGRRYVDSRGDQPAARAAETPYRDVCSRCGAVRLDRQLGLEATPEAFIASMVGVFEEVRRVLRPDGTLWLNMGDSYATTGGHADTAARDRRGAYNLGNRPEHDHRDFRIRGAGGIKAKDLLGIPWMLAFALRAAGWWLRQDVIWNKKNPMPESVGDRCTKAHEYLFLLTKSPRYYFDADAIAEAAATAEEYVHAGDAPGLHSGESHAGSGKSTRRFKKGIGGWAAGDGNDHSAVEHAKGERGANSHGAAVKTGRSGNSKRVPAGARGVPGAPTDTTNGHLASGVPWQGVTRNKRSVWTIASEPFPEAHFATFPTALVEPCILAGTSAIGCCAACGAPWKRVTSTSYVKSPKHNPETLSPMGNPRNQDNRWGTYDAPRLRRVSATEGWQPGCHCDAAIVPCTVLDPFGGSGTTAVVAERHHRNSVLVELKRDYITMAERRIRGDAPLLTNIAIEEGPWIQPTPTHSPPSRSAPPPEQHPSPSEPGSQP